jgi:hypothetical protein
MTIEERALIVERMPLRQKAQAQKAYEEFVRLGKATAHIFRSYPDASNVRPCLDGFVFHSEKDFGHRAPWCYSREGVIGDTWYKTEEHAILAAMADKHRGPIFSFPDLVGKMLDL